MSMCLGCTEVEPCGPEEFTCRGQPGECVPLTWMCDDNPDCSDSSDEKACSKGCYIISINYRLKLEWIVLTLI